MLPAWSLCSISNPAAYGGFSEVTSTFNAVSLMQYRVCKPLCCDVHSHSPKNLFSERLRLLCPPHYSPFTFLLPSVPSFPDIPAFYTMEAIGRSAAEATRLEIVKNKNNQTALQTIISASWVPELGYRGTMSIFWSCTLTISACIYTVLHINILSKQGTWSRLLEKLKWVLAGLLAPELILHMAFSQHSEARRLRKKLTKLIPKRGTRDEKV